MHMFNYLYINNTRGNKEVKENNIILSEKALGMNIQETVMSPSCITCQFCLGSLICKTV